jgi:hypothetical protein
MRTAHFDLESDLAAFGMVENKLAYASESEAEVKVVAINGISWPPISNKLFLNCGEFVGARFCNSRMPNCPLLQGQHSHMRL